MAQHGTAASGLWVAQGAASCASHRAPRICCPCAIPARHHDARNRPGAGEVLAGSLGTGSPRSLLAGGWLCRDGSCDNAVIMCPGCAVRKMWSSHLAEPCPVPSPVPHIRGGFRAPSPPPYRDTGHRAPSPHVPALPLHLGTGDTRGPRGPDPPGRGCPRRCCPAHRARPVPADPAAKRAATMPDSPADVKTQPRSTPPSMPPPPPAVTQGATRHPSFTPSTSEYGDGEGTAGRGAARLPRPRAAFGIRRDLVALRGAGRAVGW